MTGPAARVIYFHGMPGSAAELALFGPQLGLATAHFHVPDRGCGVADEADPFGAIAEQLRQRFPGESLDLIGFSLGSCAALRVAGHLGGQVRRIDLVSAAAPLCCGNWLDAMAGGPLFRLAGRSAWAFGMAARAQQWAARLMPGRLVAALLASAQGADRVLARNPDFVAGMRRVVRDCLIDDLSAYRREIMLYVMDWTQELVRVTSPVHLWHGDADNWSPPGMATALASRLPDCREVRMLSGLSHYSALAHVLRERTGAG